MDTAPLEALAREEQERQDKYQRRIYCCTSTACLSSGAGETQAALEKAVKGCGCHEHDVEIVKTGCMGLCSQGPLVRVESKDEPPALYGGVTPAVACEIVNHHVPSCPCDCEPEPLETHSFDEHSPHVEGKRRERHVISLELPFFTKQRRVVTENMGRVDPEKLTTWHTAATRP